MLPDNSAVGDKMSPFTSSMSKFHYSQRRRSTHKALVSVTLALGALLWLLYFHLSYGIFTTSLNHDYKLIIMIEIRPNSEPQPTIGKVTMIYGNNTIYEQALQTHEEHSRRLGYAMFVLRKPVLDGVWNKYVALLSTLMQELEKPIDRRLQWLL